MKLLTEKELEKAADFAWECFDDHDGIDYLSFVQAYELGYAKCLQCAEQEFKELLRKIYGTHEINNQMKG